MNERIRELAEQAELAFIKPTGMLSGLSLRGQEQSYKKFAELIVRECANRIRFCIENDIDFIAEDIEKHFGVEE